MKQEHFQGFKSHKKPKQIPVPISRRELKKIRQGIHFFLSLIVCIYIIHITKVKIVKKPSQFTHQHIYNAQTKGIHARSMVKPVLQGEGCTSCAIQRDTFGVFVRFVNQG